MEYKLCTFLKHNKENKNLFEMVILFIAVEINVSYPELYKDLESITLSYFNKYSISDKNDFNVTSPSFLEFINLNDQSPNFIKLVNTFSKINVKILCFILSNLCKENTTEHLAVFLVMVDKNVIEKYIPGILSYLFRQIEEEFNDELTVKLVHYILCKDIKFDSLAEKIITQFFLQTIDKFYASIWYVIATKFNLMKKYYIAKLINCNYNVREEWYKIINDSILDIYSPFLISKLIERNKFEFKNTVFELIKKEYEDTCSNEELIILIQNKFESQIKSPIYNLLPVSDCNTNIVISNCTNKETAMYIKRAMLVDDGFFLAKFFLSCTNLTMRKLINREVDIKSILIKNENRLFEWLFVKSEEVLNKYENNFDKLTELLGQYWILDIKHNSKLYNEDDEYIKNLIQDKFLIENKLCDGLSTIYSFKEYLPYSNIQDIIFSLTSILYKIKNKKLTINIFKIIKMVVLGDDDLNKDFLHCIFYELLYYDIDSCDIRILKYEIFNCLILRWFVVDKKSLFDINRPMIDLEDLKIIHRKSFNKLKENNLETVANNCENNESVYVLCAKLWDEIKIIPEEKEILSLINLLKTIITLTGTFYQRRFLSSSLYKAIISYCDKSLETNNDKVCYSFCKKINENFDLPKENKNELEGTMSRIIIKLKNRDESNHKD